MPPKSGRLPGSRWQPPPSTFCTQFRSTLCKRQPRPQTVGRQTPRGRCSRHLLGKLNHRKHPPQFNAQSNRVTRRNLVDRLTRQQSLYRFSKNFVPLHSPYLFWIRKIMCP
jgi:hypothetical protein